ncbi:hypothetical protein EOS_32220 [Caballeronia mineralivorans PML1(12)]|uniref:Uncharacterized protein n=1 Tax=Caballeronia mineralivorans PML1(12) TaxID=908627 RepID=A0A0J1CNK5_9BURK|nr:hypothetical protein EOS_32220 [Caballeronia mineralivorans PML1(12)]
MFMISGDLKYQVGFFQLLGVFIRAGCLLSRSCSLCFVRFGSLVGETIAAAAGSNCGDRTDND